MKLMETSGQWPHTSQVVAKTLENKSPVSSPARTYTYRTPGLSISRSFDKETYINSTPSSPSSPTSAFHMPEDTCSGRSYSKRLYKVDDGSETSDTTGSREAREQSNEECEVEVVKMDSSEVVLAQDGAVESCDIVDNSSKLATQFTNQDEVAQPFHDTEVQVPDRQKSAMQAFLTSPTSLNWDDLVRSMREEMYIKTITIRRDKSDDSSSIGSLGSSREDNKSTGSMNSSLSSKSSFLRRTRDRAKVKGGPGRRRNRNKKESLEKKVERVLSSSDRKKKSYQYEPHPLFTKSKVVGGKRCAFSAVTKLPSIPCSPNTPLRENDDGVLLPPTIERQACFNPVEQPSTSCETSEVISPKLVEAGEVVIASSQAQQSPPRVQTNKRKPNATGSNPAEDPPLLLKTSISADSDDSFYYHIRGKPASKVDSPSRAKSSKTKGPKNPYAFSNHPLLPAVVEEGHIAPFPTTFDELDSENEPLKDMSPKDNEEPECHALGSFAASIGKVESTPSFARLQMYKSPSRRRRRRSFWQIIAPCCTRTKVEI